MPASPSAPPRADAPAPAPGNARLDAADTTLVFTWDDGIPALVYFGPALPEDTDLDTLTAAMVRPLAMATLDRDEPVSLLPEPAGGFPGRPGLIGRRDGAADGWDKLFTLRAVARDEDTVQFRLDDRPRRLALEIRCALDPLSGVAELVTRLTNRGEDDFEVAWLSAPVLAPNTRFSDQIAFDGRWCAEFDLDRRPIPLGQSVKENRRGRTSHDAVPSLILAEAATDEDHGLCLGAHLGWSGNHRRVLERLPSGDLQLQFGVLLLPGEGRIGPGHSLETPTLYAAQSPDGFNGLSERFHRFRRSRQDTRADRPRPVVVNTWEALYFDHHADSLARLIDAAAEIGAERFVLDDGWFLGRADDTAGLGDWFPDPAKYPDGLRPVADRVRARGMDFGLWVEPEMISPNSDLYRAHPDWALGLGDYPAVTGRNQLILDLTNPEVTGYLFDRLRTLVEENGVAFLKWDMNRDLALPGDTAGRPAALRQTAALYGLVDRLREACPGLEIESCASGGGRADFAMLDRTDRIWPSDSNDPVERMAIQMGASYFLPSELLGAHIGPAWSHTSGRGTDIDLRGLVAGTGHFGVETDITQLDPEAGTALRAAVDRYKRDRGIWHRGRFRRIRTADPGLVGVSVVSDDHARLVLVQTARPRATHPPRIPVLGLTADRAYRVRLQHATPAIGAGNRRLETTAWHTGFLATGSVLQHVGLTLPILPPQSGIAVAIDPIPGDLIPGDPVDT